MSDKFTADQLDTLRRFEHADDAPESLRERVAAAIWATRCYNTRWCELNGSTRAMFLGFADGAIAAMKAAQ